MTKYVLSIDGGGVRGLASATFLSELDKAVPKKLSESFDLIVGTSTGGIIAPVSYTHLTLPTKA